MRAAVARDVDAAVIGTGPDHIAIDCARRNGNDRRVILRGGDVGSDAAGLVLVLPFLAIRGEVGTDGRPRLTAVRRLVHVLAAEIKTVAIERIRGNGRVPV